jgi:hypothetical protein
MNTQMNQMLDEVKMNTQMNQVLDEVTIISRSPLDQPNMKFLPAAVIRRLSLGPVIAWIAQKRAGTEGGSAGCAILVCVPKKGREIKNQHSWGTCMYVETKAWVGQGRGPTVLRIDHPELQHKAERANEIN